MDKLISGSVQIITFTTFIDYFTTEILTGCEYHHNNIHEINITSQFNLILQDFVKCPIQPQ